MRGLTQTAGLSASTEMFMPCATYKHSLMRIPFTSLDDLQAASDVQQPGSNSDARRVQLALLAEVEALEQRNGERLIVFGEEVACRVLRPIGPLCTHPAVYCGEAELESSAGERYLDDSRAVRCFERHRGEVDMMVMARKEPVAWHMHRVGRSHVMYAKCFTTPLQESGQTWRVQTEYMYKRSTCVQTEYMCTNGVHVYKWSTCVQAEYMCTNGIHVYKRSYMCTSGTGQTCNVRFIMAVPLEALFCKSLLPLGARASPSNPAH
eukprot:1161944-Pelagomonas_calceolata.AAC.6